MCQNPKRNHRNETPHNCQQPTVVARVLFRLLTRDLQGCYKPPSAILSTHFVCRAANNSKLVERFGGFCVDCLITCSNSQRKTHQIAPIRHSEPQIGQYTATEALLHLF